MATRSLADFQRLADDLPWPIWTHTPAGDIDWANRAWYDFARLPHEIATNAAGWVQVVHPDDYTTLLDALQTALAAGEPLELELRIKPGGADDDAFRWFLIRSQPRYDAAGKIAYRLGSAMDIHASRARNEEEARAFRTVAEGIPGILWTAGPDGAVEWYNARWFEYTGQSPDEAIGWGWDAVSHPDDTARVVAGWTASVRSGEPFEIESRVRGRDGVHRWFLTRARALRDGHGTIVRWCGAVVDIDEARRAADRERFYARMSEELSATLSLQDTLAAVTRMLAPDLVDYALINMIAENGEPVCAAVYDPDPDRNAVLSELVGATYSTPNGASGTRLLLRTGEAVHFERITDEIWSSIKPEFVDIFRRLGLEAGVGIPLTVHGRPIGTITGVMASAHRHFAHSDLPLFGELARRISPALANAEAYERERRVARTFQSAAMANVLPSVPGLRLDAIYEAAHAEATVGGDWFDAVRLPDGRVVFSIGDVAGSGLDAAVTMGSVRQSIRTAALINPEPSAVLDAVDRIVRAMSEKFVTAFVALFDPLTFELRAASAGHPIPVLRLADGTTSLLSLEADVPLGLRRRTAVPSATIVLPPGSVMIAYTDGLLEFDRDPLRGEQALLTAAAAPGVPLARDVYDAIARGRAARDDVAVFVVAFDEPSLRADGGAHAVRWRFSVDDADRAHAARRHYAQRLRAFGVAEQDVVSSEVVFGELIGNVYRYAPGDVEVVLDLSSPSPVLHVLDEGEGFEFRPRLPSDLLSERGRGLFLVGALAEDFSVERRAAGGSHARVVLVAPTRSRATSTLARDALV